MNDSPSDSSLEFLAALESVLTRVDRPGDFCVQGALELPMPQIDVGGVGLLGFPLPASQAQALIAQAERAPYGRGAETLIDLAVRRVWQIPPARLQIGGKYWQRSMGLVMEAVQRGLGIEGEAVTAEFYKLLIYDEGSFFLPHRDSEKAAGMFGTLLLVLPSPHRGGELLLRHAGAEVAIDVSGVDPSEIGFAAFYADCEHEVKPIMAGYRLCLVYNLVRPPQTRLDPPLIAPLYADEATQAAGLLRGAFAAADAPRKLCWLLDHQYTPAELRFSALKGCDAAVGKLLCSAATAADCAVHLGVVHIEESGPAEIKYSSYQRGRYRHYDDDDDVESDEEFEVVEVSDASSKVDTWIDREDQPVDFGPLPLEDGELLPVGALDDEPPDEQRLFEASGNEGASFERAYHRAVLVLWPQSRTIDVLLQAGVAAALPHLSAILDAGDNAAVAHAERIVLVWETLSDYRSERGTTAASARSRMLELLARLPGSALLARFLRSVMLRDYCGAENAPLAACSTALDAHTLEDIFSTLLRRFLPRYTRSGIDLLCRLLEQRDDDAMRNEALTRIAAVLVETLPLLAAPSKEAAGETRRHPVTGESPDAEGLARLLQELQRLPAPALRAAVARTAVAQTTQYDPVTVLVPALQVVATSESDALGDDTDRLLLWRHAAEFLLARSEYPPAPPSDWRHVAAIACRCEDCQALLAFVEDPSAQIGRFRVRQDRRQHLHQQIEKYQLDMRHVTERKGSPQTLVCSKTRGAYERRCRQYADDIQALRSLAMIAVGSHALNDDRRRMEAACSRAQH